MIFYESDLREGLCKLKKNISLFYSYNDKCFRQRLCRKNTHFMFCAFFSKIMYLWENLEKIRDSQTDRSHMAI